MASPHISVVPRDQMGISVVSCAFANDPKEYLVVGTAYVLEEVSLELTLSQSRLPN